MELDARQTIILAILTLFLGKSLNKRIAFLREYNIPEPVTGGVLVSILFGAIYFLFGVEYTFYLESRDTFLIVFFTTIGLSSTFGTLKSGGPALLVLLVVAVVYLSVQNLTGIAVATLLGLDPKIGLVGGSVSLSGGHGTAIAWAPRFVNDYGISGAMEIGLACATFGLILGGIIGGPIAKFLIRHYNLEPEETEEHITVGISHEEKLERVDVDSMLNCILVICLALGAAIHVHPLGEQLGIDLPDFVYCLFGGIIVANIGPLLLPKVDWPAGTASLALVSDLCLGLFLAMSLMSLQLWTLAEMGGAILAIMIAQVIAVVLFVIFVVFRAMGRSYDAAVMASGYAGLALGATPTAIANMTAVTKKFGASPRAFLIVPLVGAFFIDISNALIIQTILSWLG